MNCESAEFKMHTFGIDVLTILIVSDSASDLEIAELMPRWRGS